MYLCIYCKLLKIKKETECESKIKGLGSLQLNIAGPVPALPVLLYVHVS